jgi:hypothetical protein
MPPKEPDPAGEVGQSPPDHAKEVANGFDQRLARPGQAQAPTTTNFAFDRGASDVPQEPMQRWLSRWLILQTSATNKRD